jgi:cholest-4-en-3-one 26-monooxygenase
LTSTLEATFDPFDASPTRDPHARLDWLRAHDPVAEVASGVFYITRHADVRAVLLDHETFSSAGNFTLEEGQGREANLIVQLDPPRHTELRRIELGGFARGAISNAEPWIRSRLEELIASFEDQGGAELMGELALPLTSHVIARLVGVPTEDAAMLAGWVRDVSAHRPRPVYELDSWARLKKYIDDLVDGRTRTRRRSDDMLSRFLAADVDGRRLDASELPFHVYQLFTAGTETTAYTIGMTLHQLLIERSRWETLQRHRELLPAVREEGLRWTSAIRSDFRTATQDTTIAGVGVPAGSRVLVSLESANRDEHVWSDPHEFRLDRGEDRRHLAFGFGIHLCLGAALARTEIALAASLLLERFPDLRLADGYEPRLVGSSVLNGLERLDVVWGR